MATIFAGAHAAPSIGSPMRQVKPRRALRSALTRGGSLTQDGPRRERKRAVPRRPEEEIDASCVVLEVADPRPPPAPLPAFPRPPPPPPPPAGPRHPARR